jgi:hypothetical protein
MNAPRRSKPRIELLSGVLALGLALSTPLALASPERELEARFELATRALETGDFGKAIIELEALADRGHVHPELSFDRGLAYWMRARSPSALSGDLGRAAAGFEEAALLRPSDAEARELADFVRAEVRARRQRSDKDDPIVRVTLDRAVLRLASPLVWSLLAIASSLLLSFGLLLRRSSEVRRRIAGSIALSLGAVSVAVLTPLAVGATWLEQHSRVAVVVAPEVALRGEDGALVEAPVLPEGTLVEIGEQHGELVELRWGPYEGRVPWSSLRVLASGSELAPR